MSDSCTGGAFAASSFLGVVRLMWATALLAIPGRLMRLFGVVPDPAALRVARILGVRHMLQGSLELLRAGQGLGRVGPAIDGAHALTMGSLAALDRRRRRVAGLDGAIATGLAIGGLSVAAGVAGVSPSRGRGSQSDPGRH